MRISLARSGKSRTGLNIADSYKSLIINIMSLKQMDSPLKKTGDCPVCQFVIY